MSFQEDMLKLSKLAQAEIRIGELLAVLQGGPIEVQQHTRERDAAKDALEAAELQREETEASRQEADREFAKTKQRLAQSLENAKRITTESQMAASNIEISSLKRRHKEFEDQIFEKMSLLEELQGRIPALKKDLDGAEAVLAKVEQDVPRLMAEARSEAQQLALQRKQGLEELDPVLRRQYVVAAKIPGSNPMTTVLDKVCQTCRNTVPPQLLVETQQERAIHVCMRCNKFIGKVQWTPDDEDA